MSDVAAVKRLVEVWVLVVSQRRTGAPKRNEIDVERPSNVDGVERQQGDEGSRSYESDWPRHIGKAKVHRHADALSAIAERLPARYWLDVS